MDPSVRRGAVDRPRAPRHRRLRRRAVPAGRRGARGRVEDGGRPRLDRGSAGSRVEARSGYGRGGFRGRLWGLGGLDDQPTNALNDIWYSSDGRRWSRQAEHAPWGPRSPVVAVFGDQLWIYSGKHTGGDDNWGGDVWQMGAVARPAVAALTSLPWPAGR